MARNAFVDEATTRRWLANLARPERLADPEMRALLRAHGRDASGSAVDTGRAAAKLVEEAVDALRPPPGATARQALPHRVLTTCFLGGAKSRQAAAALGLSERQLSRERSRAISLLAAQLQPPAAAATSAGPPPLPDPLLPRPRLSEELVRALRGDRRVRVAGPPGAGKTVLVAAHAAAARERVFWYRAGAGLAPLLFELGEHLAPEDATLSEYVRAALPDPDPGLATRIALAALGARPRLLVVDGRTGGSIDAFLAEVVARLPLVSVVTIARYPRSPASIRVVPFDRAEVGALLELHGLAADERLAALLHSWTRGHAGAVAAAAAWLARPQRGGALQDSLRAPAALARNLSGMAGAARRPYGRSVSSIS
ncbi:MAG TPA: hypothetical protein VHJ76_02125 [Actinomycetota bacterium]|nr:hypothetical protein [Actinomycetota bacterium]